MTEHYYAQNPTSAHHLQSFSVEIFGNRLTFSTDSGVFSRDGLDAGTRILLNSLESVSGRFLDLACGWGPVGIAVAKKYPAAQVVMTDINHRATDLARQNARTNGVSPEIVSGDGFEAVSGLFNAIAVNPPIRAGKQVIYDLFLHSREHLLPGGRLYVVIRKQQGAPSALKYLQTLFREANVVERSGGYWVIRSVQDEALPVDKRSGDNLSQESS